MLKAYFKKFISKNKAASSSEKEDVKDLLTHKEKWIRSLAQEHLEELFKKAIEAIEDAKCDEVSWKCCGYSIFSEKVIRSKREQLYKSSEQIVRIISFEFSNKIMRKKALERFQGMLRYSIFPSILKLYRGDYLSKSLREYSYPLHSWRCLLEELAHYFIEEKSSKILTLNQLKDSFRKDEHHFSEREERSLTLFHKFFRQRKKISLAKIEYCRFCKKYRKKERKNRDQDQLIYLLMKGLEGYKETENSLDRRTDLEIKNFPYQLLPTLQVILGLMTFGFDEEEEFLYKINLGTIFSLFFNIIEDSRIDLWLRRDVKDLFEIFWKHPMVVEERDEILESLDIQSLPRYYRWKMEGLEKIDEGSGKSKKENILELLLINYGLFHQKTFERNGEKKES